MTNSINKLHKFRVQKQLVCFIFDLTFLLEQKSKQKIQGSHTILLKIFILQSDDLSASRTAKIIRTQANSFEEYDFFTQNCMRPVFMCFRLITKGMLALIGLLLRAESRRLWK
jgi:hypothetical protein